MVAFTWDVFYEELQHNQQVIVSEPFLLVFAGSVRSGLLTLRDMNRDLDRSTVTIKDQTEPAKTAVFGPWTGLNQSWS